MRGTQVKRIKKFAIGLFKQANEDKKYVQFAQAKYLKSEKTGQIICAGYRGIYQAIKKMYMRNEVVV